MDAFRGIPPNVDFSLKNEEKDKSNNGFESASSGQADFTGQMGVFANFTIASQFALASQLLQQQQQQQSNGNNKQQQIPLPIPPSSLPPPQLLPSPVIIPLKEQQPQANSVIFPQFMLYNLLLRRNIGIEKLLEVPMGAAQSPSAPLIFNNSPLNPASSLQTELVGNGTNRGGRKEVIDNGTNFGGMALVENGTKGGGMALGRGISPASSLQTELVGNGTNRGGRKEVIDNGTNFGGMALVENGINGGGMAFHKRMSPWSKDVLKSEVSPLTIGSFSSSKRNPTICVVCSKMSMYNYYGVKCCESCKQFFRRIIVRQTEFFCARTGKCEIEGGVEKCRGCRMDKCLLVGMDPYMINAPKSDHYREQFLAKLEHRRTQLMLKKWMGRN